MKMMNRFLLIILFLASSAIVSVEERNLFPFFHIQSLNAKIEPDNKFIDLCRAESPKIFDYMIVEKFECYKMKGNLELVIKRVSDIHKKKKEILLLFFDRRGKVYRPKFQADGKEFFMQSIIFNRKEKKSFIELLDSESSYYLYSVDPSKIEFPE